MFEHRQDPRIGYGSPFLGISLSLDVLVLLLINEILPFWQKQKNIGLFIDLGSSIDLRILKKFERFNSVVEYSRTMENSM